MNIKTTEAVHALQFLKPIQRHLAGSSHELKELSTFFLVKRADCAPEPLDLRRGSGVVVVFCVALPIIHVNFRQTGDQQLQFLLVEDGNEFSGNDIMEAYPMLAVIVKCREPLTLQKFI